MKPKNLLILVVCIFICFEIGNAQGFDHWFYYNWFEEHYGHLKDKYPMWYHDALQKYLDMWEEYYAAKYAWEMGYVQDWNENMQKGIERLNTTPQKNGVTPVNGALLLAESDISFPGRGGNNIAVTRCYNSKIWYSDSEEVATLGIDRLKAGFWMGEGWDLHFGRYWQTSDDDYRSKVFENPSGNKVYFKWSTIDSSEYIATDGSFAVFRHDTLYLPNGDMMIYTTNPTITYYYIEDTLEKYETVEIHSIEKFVDNNGNITTFFYNTEDPPDLGVFSLKTLDSIKTSINEKINFHYHQEFVNETFFFVLLDSITYVGFNDAQLKIRYHYIYEVTDTSPFGNDFVSEIGDFAGLYYKPTFLLKNVIYPNGDSVYYGYNDCYELTSVHGTSGGITYYDYVTDSFFIPHSEAYPPQDSAEPRLQLTRGIEKVKLYNPYHTAHTDSILYSRIFRTNPSGNRAMSNPDSVTIIDPEGNYEVSIFKASDAPPREEVTQWEWDNGVLLNKRFHESEGTLLKKILQAGTRLITADSIPVLKSTRINDGLKTYKVSYQEYDDYGNARLIHAFGDIDRNDDDRYIHRKFIYSSSYTSFWLSESCSGS